MSDSDMPDRSKRSALMRLVRSLATVTALWAMIFFPLWLVASYGGSSVSGHILWLDRVASDLAVQASARGFFTNKPDPVMNAVRISLEGDEAEDPLVLAPRDRLARLLDSLRRSPVKAVFVDVLIQLRQGNPGSAPTPEERLLADALTAWRNDPTAPPLLLPIATILRAPETGFPLGYAVGDEFPMPEFYARAIDGAKNIRMIVPGLLEDRDGVVRRFDRMISLKSRDGKLRRIPSASFALRAAFEGCPIDQLIAGLNDDGLSSAPAPACGALVEYARDRSDIRRPIRFQLFDLDLKAKGSDCLPKTLVDFDPTDRCLERAVAVVHRDSLIKPDRLKVPTISEAIRGSELILAAARSDLMYPEAPGLVMTAAVSLGGCLAFAILALCFPALRRLGSIALGLVRRKPVLANGAASLDREHQPGSSGFWFRLFLRGLFSLIGKSTVTAALVGYNALMFSIFPGLYGAVGLGLPPLALIVIGMVGERKSCRMETERAST